MTYQSSSKSVVCVCCGGAGGGGKSKALFVMDVCAFSHNVMCSARFSTSGKPRSN